MIDLSIITVCYNAHDALKGTITSILKQKFDLRVYQIEYVVIDNNSSDGTLELIDTYADKFARCGIALQYIRESDKGIYDAMNKGIVKSRGEWIQYLNAGDTLFESSSLSTILQNLDGELDVLVGAYNRLNPVNSVYIVPQEVCEIKKSMVFCHQAIVFRRRIHMNHLYDLHYQIVADYNAILRMYLSGAKFSRIDECIVNYDVTGLSAKRMIETHKEIFQVRKDNEVLGNKGIEYLKFWYGLLKRKILLAIPQGLRWKLVAIKMKYVGMKYV